MELYAHLFKLWSEMTTSSQGVVRQLKEGFAGNMPDLHTELIKDWWVPPSPQGLSPWINPVDRGWTTSNGIMDNGL